MYFVALKCLHNLFGAFSAHTLVYIFNIWKSLFPQNFLTVLQRSILKDKAVVDVFKALISAVNPVQGIVCK